MEYVATRREQWPDMHVYHYANYEKAALLRLAASHGVCEDEVDDLLRANVLVDLYPLVTRFDPRLAALLQPEEARAPVHGRRAPGR